MTRLATAFLAILFVSAPLAAGAQTTSTEEVIKPVVEGAAEAVEAPATPETAAATETPAAAETAADAEAPAETTEAAAEAQPKAEIEAVDTQRPAEPAEVVRETFGDWDIVCSPGGETCVMAQKGADGDGREIMEVRIRRVANVTKDKITIVGAIQIAVPIGVILPAGVILQIDSAKPLPAAYRVCNQTACLVQEAVDTGLVNAMKKGAKAVFTMVAPPNIKIPIDISLKGFTAAFNSLVP